ncbi:MAG: GNAT family N-acetyltransferase [Pseudomonadota bacterium]
MPSGQMLDAALEATWPPARSWQVAGVTLRDGHGGGKRVSAATCDHGPWDIVQAETAMQMAGQTPLFRVRSDQAELDQVLAARSYRVIDPTLFYTAPPQVLLNGEQQPLDAVTSETLLGIAAEIWSGGGIGPDRLAVMDRVCSPRAYLVARLDDRAAGTGFVALHGTVAMVHALEVRPHMRRRNAGRAMLHRAAKWASLQGAAHLTLAVTEGNTAANLVYTALGMKACGRYHYREQSTGAAT